MVSYLIKGILIGLLFGMPVGAVGAMTVQRTIAHGTKAGLLTGLGSSAADCLYACVGAFGLTLISDFMIKYQTVINVIGGILILIIGFGLLCRRSEEIGNIPQKQTADGIKMFLSSFAVGIINPAMCFTAACSGNFEDVSTVSAVKESNDKTEAVQPEESIPDEKSIHTGEEDETALNIEITVQDRTFYAKLYDNETAEKFAEMLPLTLDMSELNGNEKYFYFSDDLPAKRKRPDKINSGDIMLYGSNCLVLFYDSFSTSYSYTPIGHIDDADGLAEALGKGGATVSFQ